MHPQVVGYLSGCNPSRIRRQIRYLQRSSSPCSLIPRIKYLNSILSAFTSRLTADKASLCISYNNSLPVHRLPVEVLAEILGLDLSNNNLSRESRAMDLFLTCRKWREALAQSPGLWTRISAGNSSGFISNCVTRTGNLPLHLYVQAQDPIRDLRRGNPSLFDRVRSVSYTGPDLHLVDDFLPTVVDLCVSFEPKEGSETEDFEEQVLRGPLLIGPGLPFRSLALSGIDLIQLDWNRLRNTQKLDLSMVKSRSASFSSDLINTLSIATGIRELVLVNITLDSVARDPIKLLLPFLYALTLININANFATYLLESITAPSCYEIVLSDAVSGSVGWGWITKNAGPRLVRSSKIEVNLEFFRNNRSLTISIFPGEIRNVCLHYELDGWGDVLLDWPSRLQEVGCLAPIHFTVNRYAGYSLEMADVSVLLPLSTLEDFPNVGRIKMSGHLDGIGAFVTRLSAMEVGRTVWPCPSLQSLVVWVPPGEIEALRPSLNPRWVTAEEQIAHGQTLLTLSSRDSPNVQGIPLSESSTSN